MMRDQWLKTVRETSLSVRIQRREALGEPTPVARAEMDCRRQPEGRDEREARASQRWQRGKAPAVASSTPLSQGLWTA
jgi:hypothetical protein